MEKSKWRKKNWTFHISTPFTKCDANNCVLFSYSFKLISNTVLRSLARSTSIFVFNYSQNENKRLTILYSSILFFSVLKWNAHSDRNLNNRKWIWKCIFFRRGYYLLLLLLLLTVVEFYYICKAVCVMYAL